MNKPRHIKTAELILDLAEDHICGKMNRGDEESLTISWRTIWSWCKSAGLAGSNNALAIRTALQVLVEAECLKRTDDLHVEEYVLIP